MKLAFSLTFGAVYPLKNVYASLSYIKKITWIRILKQFSSLIT